MPNHVRGRLSPIPSNLDQILNKLQLATLHRLEEFGWHLWFVRRPLFQTVIAIVVDTVHNVTALLEEDGSMVIEHGVVFRT